MASNWNPGISKRKRSSKHSVIKRWVWVAGIELEFNCSYGEIICHACCSCVVGFSTVQELHEMFLCNSWGEKNWIIASIDEPSAEIGLMTTHASWEIFYAWLLLNLHPTMLETNDPIWLTQHVKTWVFHDNNINEVPSSCARDCLSLMLWNICLFSQQIVAAWTQTIHALAEGAIEANHDKLYNTPANWPQVKRNTYMLEHKSLIGSVWGIPSIPSCCVTRVENFLVNISLHTVLSQ